MLLEEKGASCLENDVLNNYISSLNTTTSICIVVSQLVLSVSLCLPPTPVARVFNQNLSNLDQTQLDPVHKGLLVLVLLLVVDCDLSL